VETPRRAGQFLRPRPRSIGYWLRRPEPSLAVGASFTVGSLLYAVLRDDPASVIMAVLMGPLTIFVWWSRDITRRNAEQWRLRRPEAV